MYLLQYEYWNTTYSVVVDIHYMDMLNNNHMLIDDLTQWALLLFIIYCLLSFERTIITAVTSCPEIILTVVLFLIDLFIFNNAIMLLVMHAITLMINAV